MKWMVLAMALVATGTTAQQGNFGKFVSDSKAKLTENFKDPDSVQYRDLGVYTQDGGSEKMLCGAFNARNGFGGFVGYRKFMASPSVAFLRSDGIDNLFDSLEPAFCNKKLATVK